MSCQRAKEEGKKSAHFYSTMILYFFQRFEVNGHLHKYWYIDIKELYTEISSLTRIIHGKPAPTGSRITFHENHGRPTLVKSCQNSQIFDLFIQ